LANKIFVGNYKGGVGKTTSVFHIAKYIADIERSAKVLMIDLDPQCSLSEICMKYDNRNLEDIDNNESLNYVFDVYHQKLTKYGNIATKLNMERLIKRIDDNVHFIPSNLFYKDSDSGLDSLATILQKDENSIFILHQFIHENRLNVDYDYIIFDCPPTNNIIIQSAFLLSDFYLIPTIMDQVSTRGVTHYISSVNKIYTEYCINHTDREFMQAIFKNKPKLLGVFETLYRYNVRNNEVIGDLDAELQDSKLVGLEDAILNEIGESNNQIIFNTRISNYVDIARSTAIGMVHSRASEYENLTREIINRIYHFKKGEI
jgi:chromosome partitioning protein